MLKSARTLVRELSPLRKSLESGAEPITPAKICSCRIVAQIMDGSFEMTMSISGT